VDDADLDRARGLVEQDEEVAVAIGAAQTGQPLVAPPKTSSGPRS
jgi:hypothetical protein